MGASFRFGLVDELLRNRRKMSKASENKFNWHILSPPTNIRF